MLLQRNSTAGWAALIPLLAMLVFLAACSSAATQQQGAATATNTPRLVIPTSSGTSQPGQGLRVITSPVPVPGGKPGSQQVVLADRTVILVSATRQKATSTGSSLISLVLTVRNTSAKTLMNLPGSFQLMSAGGDAFGYQYNSSDTFYGPIAAHTNRDGLIVFEVPTAAASGLRLLYRPESATEAVLIPLALS